VLPKQGPSETVAEFFRRVFLCLSDLFERLPSTQEVDKELNIRSTIIHGLRTEVQQAIPFAMLAKDLDQMREQYMAAELALYQHTPGYPLSDYHDTVEQKDETVEDETNEEPSTSKNRRKIKATTRRKKESKNATEPKGDHIQTIWDQPSDPIWRTDISNGTLTNVNDSLAWRLPDETPLSARIQEVKEKDHQEPLPPISSFFGNHAASSSLATIPEILEPPEDGTLAEPIPEQAGICQPPGTDRLDKTPSDGTVTHGESSGPPARPPDMAPYDVEEQTLERSRTLSTSLPTMTVHWFTQLLYLAGILAHAGLLFLGLMMLLHLVTPILAEEPQSYQRNPLWNHRNPRNAWDPTPTIPGGYHDWYRDHKIRQSQLHMGKRPTLATKRPPATPRNRKTTSSYAKSYWEPDVPFGAPGSQQGYTPRSQEINTDRMTYRGGYLRDLRNEAMTSLHVIANLGMGAVAVPHGLATVATQYLYIPLLLHMAPPQWLTEKLRHPKAMQACNYVDKHAPYERCIRAILPRRAREDCPLAERMENDSSSIIHEFHHQHLAATQAGTLNHLLHNICANNPTFCQTTKAKRGTGYRRRLPRRARKMQAKSPKTIQYSSFTGTLSNGGFTTLGRTITNARELEHLDRSIAHLKYRMAEADRSLRTLTHGPQQLEDQGRQIFAYAPEELQRVFSIVERTRCALKSQRNTLTWWMGLHYFQQYLFHQLEAVLRTYATGKVTPDILPRSTLEQILKTKPLQRDSILLQNLDYVYQQAVLFPVHLQFQGLMYGYLLQIPNLKREDIYPLYRIHSIGFHLPKERSRNLLPEVLHVPLPDYAVLTREQGLVALDMDNCDSSTTITACHVGAKANDQFANPCLTLLANDKCYDCSMAKQCMIEITAKPPEGREYKVLTTPAGAFVRTFTGPVRTYLKATHGRPGHIQNEYNQSPLGTYWLSHSSYDSYTIGTAHFQHRGLNILNARTVKNTPFKIAELRKLLRDVSPNAPAINRYHAKRIHQLSQQIEELKRTAEEKSKKHNQTEPNSTPFAVVDTLVWEFGQIGIFGFISLFLIVLAISLCCCTSHKLNLQGEQLWNFIRKDRVLNSTKKLFN
jgi:hypothetical protein